MKYNWKIRDLRVCQRNLIKLMQNELNPEKKDYMLLILNSINEYIREESGKSFVEGLEYNERLENISSELVLHSQYYSYINLFTDITSGLMETINTLEEKLEESAVIKKISSLSRTRITNNRAMSLMDGFYREFSPSLYPTFKRAYDQRKNSVRFVRMSDSASADSVYFDIIDRYFINSSKTNDISKLYDLIHEFGHVVSFLVNPQAIYLVKNNMYTEVASIFPELVARKENVGGFNSARLALDEYAQLVSLVGTSLALSFHTPFVNLWQENNCNVDNNFFKEALEFYDCDKDMVDDYLDTNIVNDGDYVLSYLVALELFHIYKSNKDKSLRIFEEILRCPYNEDLHKLVCSRLDIGHHAEEEAVQIIDKFTLSLRKSGICNV